MDSTIYVDAITRGHFLYWDMLSNLRGIENHKEDHLRWLTGGVYYNYFTDTNDVDGISRRMKNEEIPKNLTFLTNDLTTDPSAPFIATGLFEQGSGTTGMAHKLGENRLPQPDTRLNLFKVREISQIKAAGAIFNASFDYRLFSFTHYIEMMENEGQFFYLAEYDGLPVGAVMSQHGDSYINISWVATLPGYRRLGIAAYLIQMAERDGVSRGKTTGVLHGRPDAVGAYRRIGYKDYCRGIEAELSADTE
jgi:GNAT superfamily N-acetyltransferase